MSHLVSFDIRKSNARPSFEAALIINWLGCRNSFINPEDCRPQVKTDRGTLITHWERNDLQASLKGNGRRQSDRDSPMITKALWGKWRNKDGDAWRTGNNVDQRKLFSGISVEDAVGKCSTNWALHYLSLIHCRKLSEKRLFRMAVTKQYDHLTCQGQTCVEKPLETLS